MQHIKAMGIMLYPNQAINKLKRVCFLVALTLPLWSYSQQENHKKHAQTEVDSVKTNILKEVVLIASKKKLFYQQEPKPLASVDEFLDSAQKVNMIKRGAYAWEPAVNNMVSERLSVTIDGMRIFAACTDKMDPITSYVDVSNLSKITVASGQEGSEHGVCVGGAIDLELDKTGFKEDYFKVNIESGFESNNKQKIIGADLNFADTNFYVDADVIYRNADNYFAGGGEEVLYSQFEKYNLSFNGGVLLKNESKLTTSFIFDEARNVGYPALPMDVSLARAFIGSVSYEQLHLGQLTHWESKLYANSITHIMDDSKRPDVPIRMDMPGWSDTYGFYSQAQLNKQKHNVLFKVDGYYNRALAEMTMYPNDPNQSAMFMLTWPDVHTLNSGIYVQDQITFAQSDLKVSTRLSFQNNRVADEFGLNSLKIFYPDMEASQNRFLTSMAAQYHKKINAFDVAAGLSYATRAPSVSEGYGFYLYNSSDNHDYIGNPNLKNEQALELNGSVALNKKTFNISLDANAFKMPNYIIGEVDTNLSPMTIGAEGVKVYQNLDYAVITNVALSSAYKISKTLNLNGVISYHRGIDNDQRNLPFISPLAYGATLKYHKKTFNGELAMRGAGKQIHYNPDFGEDQSDAYTIFSLALGKTFYVSKNQLYLKTGVENIFDTYYSTYSDWNNIPRMGRNIYVSLSYKIN
ncbi:TonB-dependent receptor [Tamlana sp. I1]|uniref:TonB-dependent receptor n=1 Tax=Tamlana sp. I1 TaxID=2762061 RepID=UPI001E3D0403|nr:TonB-dependent receptor [Tamlana sp. I1]